MKLFLSGGGSGQDSLEIDKKFINSIDVEKPVLYIPIAIDTVKHPYPECLNWIKENFNSFDFNNFIMWTEKDLKNKTEKDFEQFGGVYIGGGNTFKLLSDLKQFGTFEILRSLAREDVPIYGGSAGAIILTRSILTSSYLDRNEINLKDFTALNLARCDIWCHYKTSMDDDIKKFMKTNDLKKIIAIPENAGLFVTEKGIEAIGTNAVISFDENNKIAFNSGEFIL